MEKDVILADKGMLTDRHMHAAHTLIGRQFPEIEGCSSTLLVQKMTFSAVTKRESKGMASRVCTVLSAYRVELTKNHSAFV